MKKILGLVGRALTAWRWGTRTHMRRRHGRKHRNYRVGNGTQSWDKHRPLSSSFWMKTHRRELVPIDAMPTNLVRRQTPPMMASGAAICREGLIPQTPRMADSMS